MNLVLVILSTFTKLENVQKGLRLATERAFGIRNPNVLEPRPQGKTLEGKAPSKVGDLGLSNSAPDGIKTISPLRERRLQMPPFVKRVHHRKMGQNPLVSLIGLVVGKRSVRIPLLIMPLRTTKPNPHFLHQMHRDGRKKKVKSLSI